MKTQVTKQIALNYLNQHSETLVENLLLQEQTDTRWVFWSEEPINNRGDFYEVVIDTASETIRWGILRGFENLNSVMNYPIKALHTLRDGRNGTAKDTFRFQGDDQLWVCWLKLNDAEDGCYFIQPVGADGRLGEGKAVHNALVRYAGAWNGK